MAIYVSNNELYDVLDSEENDVLDFKSADLLTNPCSEHRYSIAKHIVGFANHRGGEIVFGINDDREPEGVRIREEEALGTISDIVKSIVNPTLDFTYSYYSVDKDDLSEGAVFILEIPESSTSLPHAIVENSEGEIRKREYRIRAGESTRLVSNEELLALFSDDPRSKIECSETIHYLLESDYTPAEIRYKPKYQIGFERHFDALGSDDESLIDKIKDGYPDDSDEATKLVVESQYALTISSILNAFPFSMINKTELNNNMPNEVDSITFDLKSLEPSDIILEEESNPLIEKTVMDKPGILPPYDPRTEGFKIPNSAEVRINEEFNGFSIVNDDFEIIVSVDLVEVGVGLPTRHPESAREHAVYSDSRYDRSKATMYSQISVNSNFQYPNQKYEDYESYKSYCESVVDRFEDIYDWESYVEQFPHDKIFKLEEKIDRILDNME